MSHIELDWNDCDGYAELAHAKRRAKADLDDYFANHYEWDDERYHELIFNALMVLRDELLPWICWGVGRDKFSWEWE